MSDETAAAEEAEAEAVAEEAAIDCATAQP